MNDLSSDFEQERLTEIKQMIAVMNLKVAVPLFFVFWLLDLVYVPQYKWEFLAIRCTIIPSAIIIQWWLKRVKTFAEAEYCALFLAFVSASILNAMIFIIGEGALYGIPLHLVAIATLGYLSLSNKKFIIAALLIYAPYLAIQLSWYGTAEVIGQFSVSGFFIMGVLVITWAAKSYRDRLRRLEFTMRKNLEVEIEKRKQTEHELIEARDKALAATRAKDSFLANMSHEIRTPLTAIIGFAEYSLDKSLPESERVSSIETIVNSGHHLLNVINDILDFSKIEADSIEIERVSVSPFAIALDVKSLVAPLASKKGLSVDIEYQFPIPEKITTDPLRLKQILINVCSNAIKFTEQGSIAINLAYNSQSNAMTYQIRDTGIGMTEEQLSKIFSPFKQADSSITRRYGGTGLGLSLSQRLAELLGGSLTATSIVNQGSEFTVAIDAGSQVGVSLLNNSDEVKLDMPEADAVKTEGRLQGHILLAEDNETNQQLLSLYLNNMGVEVTCVENGAVAVEFATNNAYDLILMDMQMPVMSGVDAVLQLRQNGYKKPIIALTANATKEDRRQCFEAGFNDFVTKPITRERLYYAVANYLSADTSGAQVSFDSLGSSVLMDYPGLKDAVQRFIDRLPEIVDSIRSAYTQKDWTSFRNEVHSLKGVGGNIGYPQITELCREMENHFQKENYPAIDSTLDKMDSLVERIKKGAPEG